MGDAVPVFPTRTSPVTCGLEGMGEGELRRWVTGEGGVVVVGGEWTMGVGWGVAGCERGWSGEGEVGRRVICQFCRREMTVRNMARPLRQSCRVWDPGGGGRPRSAVSDQRRRRNKAKTDELLKKHSFLSAVEVDETMQSSRIVKKFVDSCKHVRS